MARQRLLQTAPGQACVLFALAGVLGLVTELLLKVGSAGLPGIAINGCSLVVALAFYRAPWAAWSPRASLVAVPLAFGLLVVGQRVAPGAPAVYGVWFVVVFAWVGFWHPPRTGLLLAPFAAVAYVAPFIGDAAAPRDAITSVAIAIPVAVTLGEAVASKMAAIHKVQRDLEETRTQLERANLTDDLTGVGNRRRANSLLDSMQPGDALVILDLDHFKVVNDTLGHAEGDRILSLLGEYLLRAVRDADTVARFGGEEFVVLLRAAGDQVGLATQRLLAGWRANCPGVTLSAGAAVHVSTRGPDATFRAADAAMYDAKRQGRDRAVLERSTLAVSV